MQSTPKRGRERDDDGDDVGRSRQRRYDDDERGCSQGSMHSPGVGSHDDDVFCSQMENPTPMAQRGLYRGQKQIQDRVHGQVTLDRLLLEVMDTPDWQRLDSIKQLGGCSYVYPSATHTRKEHSIGVCHLAGVMVKHLRKEQHYLGIDDDDELCVKLAGLVHDIGHGPFSHMFEDFVHSAGQAARDAAGDVVLPDKARRRPKASASLHRRLHRRLHCVHRPRRSARCCSRRCGPRAWCGTARPSRRRRARGTRCAERSRRWRRGATRSCIRATASSTRCATRTRTCPRRCCATSSTRTASSAPHPPPASMPTHPVPERPRRARACALAWPLRPPSSAPSLSACGRPARGHSLEEHFVGAATGEEHLNFVVLLVQGLDDERPWPGNVGRGEEKRFLLDIVSNARNGIDVDKLDYLVRDAMSAFGSSKPPVFDIYRMIHSSRVLRRPRGRLEVCFQMKARDRTEIAPWRTPAPPPACRPAERRPRISPCSCPCCRSRRRR